MSFLNENEIDSQSDDSEDEEYKPSGHSDVYSEEESNCSDNDEKLESKKIKKSGKRERNRKGRKKNVDTEIDNSNNNDPAEVGITEEEDKKRSDALWADFLGDANVASKEHSKPSSTVSQSNDSRSCESSDTDNSQSLKKIIHSAEESPKQTVHRLEKQTTKTNPIKPSVSKPAAKPSGIALKRPAGGIHSILGQINKKSKLTVLERSKQDWDSFKSSHGLNEELRSFNRGKEGYLEKQDFLERTDLRQFEIEKGMRQGRRNK